MSTTMSDITTPQDEIDPTDTVSVWGWCASFCCADGPTNGDSVEHHGSVCQSLSQSVYAVDANQDDVDILTRATRSYQQGTVHRSVTRRVNVPRVELSFIAPGIEGDDETGEAKLFRMTPGEARSLAKHLSWFADVVDGCTGDPNEALARREVELERERRAAKAATA